jgi:hypothetical protein
MDQTLEILAGQGVSVVTFDTIVDQPPAPTYFSTSQSGVYYLGGRPKPTLAAFEFPFVASRENGVTSVWGLAPTGGRVRIQVRAGDKWLTARSLLVKRSSTFHTHIVDNGPVTVRAQLPGHTSIVWNLP